MKKIFCLVFAIGIISCNNSNKKIINIEKDNATIKDSSTSRLQLTLAEQEDDSSMGLTSWQDAGINDPLALKIFV